jgi:hypothetical protein
VKPKHKDCVNLVTFPLNPTSNGYKHPSRPLRLKGEIELEKVKRFIMAIDDLTVKCMAC